MPSTFRQSIRVFVDANLSPAAQSARLAGAARTAVADLVASGQAGPRYTTYVDGQAGADESRVKPRGVILYEFSSIGDAAEFAVTFLIARSGPAVSGAYRAGFVVAVNGRPIPARMFRKASVPPDAEVLIYNVEPYSRKIDVQLSGGRRLKYRTPPNLFDDAARAVKGRFGNSVAARRLYTIRFAGQATIRRGKAAGRIVDSPALVLTSLR